MKGYFDKDEDDEAQTAFSTPTNTSIMYQKCTAQPQYQPQACKPHGFSDLALAPLRFSEIPKESDEGSAFVTSLHQWQKLQTSQNCDREQYMYAVHRKTIEFSKVCACKQLFPHMCGFSQKSSHFSQVSQIITQSQCPFLTCCLFVQGIVETGLCKPVPLCHLRDSP